MWPGASVSGYYFWHPASAYFGVGRIGRDQVADYAARKGVPVAEAERWLAPNLADDDEAAADAATVPATAAVPATARPRLTLPARAERETRGSPTKDEPRARSRGPERKVAPVRRDGIGGVGVSGDGARGPGW